MNYVVLVDGADKDIGKEEKVKAHTGEGVLHRAFSVFVFDSNGRILLQKRASGKMLWPGYWSNTCCSHPLPGEGVMEAGERRLREELGFTCSLSNKGHFIYEARYGDVGVEKEFCYVLVGEYDGEELAFNQEEVEEIKWVPLKEVIKRVEEQPSEFTPWFKIEIKKFFKNIS